MTHECHLLSIQTDATAVGKDVRKSIDLPLLIVVLLAKAFQTPAFEGTLVTTSWRRSGSGSVPEEKISLGTSILGKACQVQVCR